MGGVSGFRGRDARQEMAIGSPSNPRRLIRQQFDGIGQIQERAVQFGDLQVDGDDALFGCNEIIRSGIHDEHAQIPMKPGATALPEARRDVHKSHTHEIFPNGGFGRVIALDGSLRDHEASILRQSLHHDVRGKNPLYQCVAGQILMRSAWFHRQHPIHHRRTETVIPGVFENPQSIISQKDIMLGSELVGSSARTGYAKMADCGKPFKCGAWLSTEALRC